MIKYVTGFLFSKDREEIALIIKKKPKWQEGKANGIGGKIEGITEEMDPRIAMCREFKEETGVYIEPQQWDHYVTLQGEGYICNFLRAFHDGINDIATVEEEEVIRINVDALDMYDHIPNLQWLIPLALDKTIKHVTVQDTGN